MIRTLLTTTFIATVLHHSLNQKRQSSLLVIAWSKKIMVFYLTKDIKHKYLVKMRPFSSAKTICIHDYTKPRIREINPEHIILHGDTNDVKLQKNCKPNSKSNNRTCELSEDETNSMHASLIVPRNNNLNNKVNEVNRRLKNMCQQRNIKVISHNLFI